MPSNTGPRGPGDCTTEGEFSLLTSAQFQGGFYSSGCTTIVPGVCVPVYFGAFGCLNWHSGKLSESSGQWVASTQCLPAGRPTRRQQ